MGYLLALKLAILLLVASCEKEPPFLSGHIKRAHDAVLTNCDPYDLGVTHSCLVFSSAYRESLYVFDATAREMVLAPNTFPLKVLVGPTTDMLVTVVSADKKFPFLMAVDRGSSSYFPIRLFPSGKNRSFAPVDSVKLNKAPHHMAAAEIDSRIVAVLTMPKEREIALMVINKESFAVETSKALVHGATKPNRVAINEQKIAVVTDGESDSIYTIDLKHASSEVKPIPIGMKSDQVFLSTRDFGEGLTSYAVVFKAAGNVVKLVNIDQGREKASIDLKAQPTAAYFPDNNSDTCCGNEKNWFSLVTADGKLHYITIKQAGEALTLDSTSDLTSDSNLVLGKVNMIKILGGAILQDPALEQEPLCKDHRQTFYVASFATSKSYRYTDPVEVEGHGYSCEGESAASRFGVKAR